MPKGQLRFNSRRLRELRIAAALSQSELANRSNLSRQTIIRAEQLGIAMPSTLRSIAAVLNIDYLDLMQ